MNLGFLCCNQVFQNGKLFLRSGTPKKRNLGKNNISEELLRMKENLQYLVNERGYIRNII